MNILISNDDGYDAPGIQALIGVMEFFGTVYVFAPDRNRSGASNSLSLQKPLTANEVKKNHFVSNGTPADCVHLALSGVLPVLPDLVMSGINQGQNMAEDTLYSGTVGAAMEGYLKGIRAIAVSQVDKDWVQLDAAAQFLRSWLDVQLPQLPQLCLLNINIPNLPVAQIEGWEYTRLGQRHPSQVVISDVDESGNSIYWIGPAGEVKNKGLGTDFHCVHNQKMSVTPLSIDLTDHAELAVLRRHSNG